MADAVFTVKGKGGDLMERPLSVRDIVRTHESPQRGPRGGKKKGNVKVKNLVWGGVERKLDGETRCGGVVGTQPKHESQKGGGGRKKRSRQRKSGIWTENGSEYTVE